MHGYDNVDPQMKPYFMATGPLFKKGGVVTPFENIDLYPLICQVMGLTTPPNNGSIQNTLPLLNPTLAKEIQSRAGIGSSTTSGSGSKSTGK